MFEFSQEESPATSRHANRVLAIQPKVKQQKLPRRVWACTCVAVIAILALTISGVAIVGMFIFGPSISEPQAVSVSEIESLKRQVEEIKQLLNRNTNSSHLMTEISKLRDGAIEDLKANLMEMQSLQLNSNQEHQLQLNRSKLQTQKLQQQLSNSTRMIGELQQQIDNSKQMNQEIQQQSNNFIQKLKSCSNN